MTTKRTNSNRPTPSQIRCGHLRFATIRIGSLRMTIHGGVILSLATSHCHGIAPYETHTLSTEGSESIRNSPPYPTPAASSGTFHAFERCRTTLEQKSKSLKIKSPSRSMAKRSRRNRPRARPPGWLLAPTMARVANGEISVSREIHRSPRKSLSFQATAWMAGAQLSLAKNKNNRDSIQTVRSRQSPENSKIRGSIKKRNPSLLLGWSTNHKFVANQSLRPINGPKRVG